MAPNQIVSRSTAAGFGRFLIAIYALFAIAATSRSVVQIATKYHEAPVAYALSSVSAVVYIIATLSLATSKAHSRQLATVTIIFELVGVLVVGTLSLVMPDAFPQASVWSGFGSGYGFIPLILPILGLWWLWRTGRNGDAEH